MNNKICNECGQELPPSAIVCTLCAAPIRGAQTAAPPQQQYTTPQQQYTTPQQQYTTPQQQYTTPQQQYTTPQQQYTTPQQQYTTPQQQYTTPQQQYTTPQQQYTTPQPQRSAPQASVQSAYTQPPLQTPPAKSKMPIGIISTFAAVFVVALIVIFAVNTGNSGGSGNSPQSGQGTSSGTTTDDDSQQDSGTGQQTGETDEQGTPSTNSPIIAIAAELDTVYGLRADGTVVKADTDNNDIPIFRNWTNIRAINSDGFIAGLQSDGTVLVSEHLRFYDNVRSWTDIVQITSTDGWTGGLIIGLKSDGTVVATGLSDSESLHRSFSDLNNIQSITASGTTIAFLKNDGTVGTMDSYLIFKEFGGSFSNLESMFTRTDIVDIAAVGYIVYALLSDGTVIYESNGYHSGVLEGWNNIASITAGHGSIVGIKRDGTLISHGLVNQGMKETISSPAWSNIVMVSTSTYGQVKSIVALKEDGTVLSSRWYENTNTEAENFNLSGW